MSKSLKIELSTWKQFQKLKIDLDFKNATALLESMMNSYEAERFTPEEQARRMQRAVGP